MKRTEGNCMQCQAPCMIMPGYLIPTDLMGYYMEVNQVGLFAAESAGIDGWEAFAAEHLDASEGAKLLSPTGQIYRLRTLVPRSTREGRCKFYGDGNQCKIHKHSPFGCRNFNVCDTTKRDQYEAWHGMNELRKAWQGEAEQIGELYTHLWHMLKAEGMVAMPLKKRRKKLMHRLDKIQRRQMAKARIFSDNVTKK